ncbi:MAG: hypothetical protein ACYS76_04575 [Planctomycetota bacterium]|jgi:hypothetical protein
MGKSAYAMKVLGEVYEYFYGEKLSIDLLKEFMGWHPAEVIAQWYQIEERIPAYIWDDAGYWLYSMDWNNPLLKAVQKYFNVIGTDMNTLILTTPDPTWILSKLINMPGTLRGNCMKSGNKSRWGRICRGYKPYRSADLKKTGVNTSWEDRYSCKIPQGIYDWYKPIRDRYARMAKKSIIDTILGVKDSTVNAEVIKNLNYLADRG